MMIKGDADWGGLVLTKVRPEEENVMEEFQMLDYYCDAEDLRECDRLRRSKLTYNAS